MTFLDGERRLAVMQALAAMGTQDTGPDLPGLVSLLEETAHFATLPQPNVHVSHESIVPSDLRDRFGEQETNSRQTLRALIQAARDAKGAMQTLPDLADIEITAFEAALIRLGGLPISATWDGRLQGVKDAIALIAGLELVLDDEEKRGQRPIYNLARLLVRASYYYRHHHNLPLEVNWEYPDRVGARSGSRSRPGDLEPRTPTARLAWGVIEAVGLKADMAEVKNHLANYTKELRQANRTPSKSDFLHEFS